jgi:hypothetical protein
VFDSYRTVGAPPCDLTFSSSATAMATKSYADAALHHNESDFISVLMSQHEPDVPQCDPTGHTLVVGQREGSIDYEAEREQDEEGVLDAQNDAEDFRIEDFQPALAHRALLDGLV